MLRTILPLILLLSLCSLNAQDGPEKLKGLLWEVSGNGIARPGYLYGTMHVPEKLAFNLSDSFFIALQQVDIVALETNHDSWQAFTEMLKGHEAELQGQGYEGSGYRSSTQINLYNGPFLFPVPDNQLLGAVLSSKPRMTNEFLYRSNQYRQDYEEDTYLDLFIFQAGRKLGKKVIGLETMEGSYEAYVRAQIPDEEPDRDRSERYYPGLYSRTNMEEAYRDQDLSLIDSLNRMMRPSKNFQRWMQDERNKIMVHGIDSILQSGTALLSAVGAAHLPGDSGLIHSLRRLGYTLRPVQFTANNSKQEKERIEALQYPVKFSLQWAIDSSWSVEAPGKFYQTVDVQGFEQYLCADMSNGAYYAVYQLQTNGLWNGQSPAYMAERIDSLVYEKIPGKILERKRLTQPFPGHEITTRTRRGDIMRYKIFATPMQVYVFATGGNGDYTAGEEGTKFLTSIRFTWPVGEAIRRDTTIRPSGGGFRMSFPARPIANTTSNPKADRYLIAASDPVDSSVYLFCRADYHDWTFIEEDTFELNVIGEKIARQFTKNTPDMRLLVRAPYPTQDISFRSDRDSAYYFLRLIIDGPHYYLLGCRNTSGASPDDFFGAFAIEPNRYSDAWTEITDTARMFRVSVPPAADPPAPPFLNRLRQIIEEGFRKSRSGPGGYPSPEKSSARFLKLPLPGEEISIQTTEISAAKGMPTQDSFQAFWQKRLTGFRKMAVREKHWETPAPDRLVGDFLLEDTNSTRGIRAKVLVTPGRVYSLYATVNLEDSESEFVRRVFDSFTPTDTTPGNLPFGRRSRQFLQDIYSADSLTREKAFTELERAAWPKNIEEEDFPAVRTAIRHPDFSRLKYVHRNNLIGLLGSFQSAEALEFTLDFYNKHPDSARYRQAVLIALAKMKTKPAFDALVRQLAPGSVYLTTLGISSIFGSMLDTLNLAARFVPKLLPLADQESFREPILELLDRLVVQKQIRPRVYARFKSGLIREAALSLGRLQYESESKNDSRDSDPYRYDSPIDYSEGQGNDLPRNLRLLAPFVQKDKRVRGLFEQAIRSVNKEIRISAYCLLLKNGMPIRRDELQPFADDDRTRIQLYRELAGAGQLSPYAGWFADTIALVRSILRNQAGDQYPGLDSIRFISRHPTSRYGVPSALFFFEIKPKKDGPWRLAALTLPLNARMFGVEADRSAIRDARESYRDYLERPDLDILPEMPETEKAEFIRKKIGEIRYVARGRYRDGDRPGRW